MTVRFYNYDVKKVDRGKGIGKLYTFTFILEFDYTNTMEYLEKFKLYSRGDRPVYVAEIEQDGNFYVYLRKKKYLLDKGVINI